MFDWSGFGEKHLDFIRTPFEKHKKITILKGAIRSGKTTAMLSKWLAFLAYQPNHLKIIAGVSKDTVYDNVLADMFDFFECFDIAYNYNTSSGMLKVDIGNGKFSLCKVVGAEKAGSERKIRGKTIAGAYVDELTLINYRFFKELLGRCSVKGSKIFCTTNPDDPLHWYNQEFGEKNPDVEIIRFTIDDNKTLPDDYKEFIKRQYKGVMYARMIEGLDVVAEGLVYDTFKECKHTCTHNEILDLINRNAFKMYFIGCDHGWTDPVAVLLFGVDANDTIYLIDELYKTQIGTEEIITWINCKQAEYGKYVRWGNFDNARPESNYNIQRNLNLTVYEEKPKLEDSIGLMRSVINYDRLIVNKDRCKNFLAEIQVYRYPDEDERLKSGVNPNQPLDKNNHAMDAARYGLFKYETTFKTKNFYDMPNIK